MRRLPWRAQDGAAREGIDARLVQNEVYVIWTATTDTNTSATPTLRSLAVAMSGPHHTAELASLRTYTGLHPLAGPWSTPPRSIRARAYFTIARSATAPSSCRRLVSGRVCV
jgi:hypothetical protein